MMGHLVGQMIASCLLVIPSMQKEALAEDSHSSLEFQTNSNTRHHVYVVGSNPDSRTVIGKALERLGYLSDDKSDVYLHSTRSLSKGPGKAITSGSYSYTEISTLEHNFDGLPPFFDSSSEFIIIQRDHNQSTFPLELKGDSLELSVGAAEALGKQAEKWVALCDFLGLGYSTVERLKLWEFP